MGALGHDTVPAVKTYRYLRLAMVLLVVGLAASIVVEWRAVGQSCFQTSISAYYYTPARGFLVGALLAIGVCLVVLKGNSEREDVLLNIAGMLAPVVAFVPTPDPGTCTSSPAAFADRQAHVANNVSALLALGLAALLLTAVIAWREHRGAGAPVPVSSRVGIALSFALWAGAALVFGAFRDAFVDRAHDVAAVSMFGCIVGVVVLNAVDFGRPASHLGARRLANRYAAVAVAMGLSVLVIVGLSLAVDWDHAVLWLEGMLIGLFALFWSIQTRELWHSDSGLRPDQQPDPAPGPVVGPGPPARRSKGGALRDVPIRGGQGDQVHAVESVPDVAPGVVGGGLDRP